jgi:hypothetical protein
MVERKPLETAPTGASYSVEVSRAGVVYLELQA